MRRAKKATASLSENIAVDALRRRGLEGFVFSPREKILFFISFFFSESKEIK